MNCCMDCTGTEVTLNLISTYEPLLTRYISATAAEGEVVVVIDCFLLFPGPNMLDER